MARLRLKSLTLISSSTLLSMSAPLLMPESLEFLSGLPPVPLGRLLPLRDGGRLTAGLPPSSDEGALWWWWWLSNLNFCVCCRVSSAAERPWQRNNSFRENIHYYMQ